MRHSTHPLLGGDFYLITFFKELLFRPFTCPPKLGVGGDSSGETCISRQRWILEIPSNSFDFQTDNSGIALSKIIF